MAASAVTPLESRRVINGREGKVFGEGSRFLGWVESIEARITIDRADIVRSGAHVTGYKPTGVSGTGTLNGFHVTSYWRRLVAQYMKTGKMPEPTEITMELSDPDIYPANDVAQIEKVTLKVVNIWETPLGYDTGDMVRDDFPFTFEDIAWLDEHIIASALMDPLKPLNPWDTWTGA